MLFRSKAVPSSFLSAGLGLTITDYLSREVKVLSIINDLTKMFNLYWDTNNTTKIITVEPRDTFFKNITTATDFTEKIDLSNGYELTDFKSHHLRYMNFNYLQDPKDGYLTERNTQAKANGGFDTACLQSYDLGSDYDDGSSTITNSIISASYFIDAGVSAPLRYPWQPVHTAPLS